MTQSELKELKAIGAELGAAKAEVERLRGMLREAVHCCPDEQLRNEMKAALSQQSEPCGTCEPEGVMATDGSGPFDCPDCGKKAAARNGSEAAETRAVTGLEGAAQTTSDTYTAVEMATAAAQGFRDGQAAVEQAPAQDEREAPAVVATAILGGLFHGGSGPELGEIDIEVCTPALEAIQCETVNSSDDVFLPLMTVAQHERIVASLARPAQTEEQPEQSRLAELPYQTLFDAIAAATEAGNEPVSISVKAFRAALEAGRNAHIAQTAPQGKFRMGDLVKKSAGSEWQGRVVGWYSTEQTKEGYAVESEAHAGSVQIYPAKALEAVDD